jgi:soluble lytic murein transglycosylase-like protein
MLRIALSLAALAVGASIVQAAPASAAVLEIGDDGAVRTRAEGPGVVWQDAAPKPTDQVQPMVAAPVAAVAPTVQAAPVTQVAQVAPTAAPAPAAAPAITPVAAGLIPVRLPAAHANSVMAAANKYGLSPLLIDAVARQESGYRANAVSRAGAIGIMQLMPGTARLMGVKDPHDPHANIDGGARYLRGLIDRFGGDIALALAAYNAGPRSVERAGGIPRIAETQNYVRRILANLSTGAAAATAAAQVVVQMASATGE